MTARNPARSMTRFQYGARQAKKYRQLYVMMLPYMLVFFAFTVVPVLVSWAHTEWKPEKGILESKDLGSLPGLLVFSQESFF